jgi:starvation-inducible outer membrane lipoprotein
MTVIFNQAIGMAKAQREMMRLAIMLLMLAMAGCATDPRAIQYTGANSIWHTQFHPGNG